MMQCRWERVGGGTDRNGTQERRSEASLAIIFLTKLESKSNQIRIWARKCQEIQKDKYNAYFHHGKNILLIKIFI